MNEMPLQATAALAWWHPAAWLGTWRDADPVLGLAALALLGLAIRRSMAAHERADASGRPAAAST